MERVAKLTEEEAKEELLKDIEKKYEEDILIRIQKLENTNEEKLDRRAKDILATSIQRLGFQHRFRIDDHHSLYSKQ